MEYKISTGQNIILSSVSSLLFGLYNVQLSYFEIFKFGRPAENAEVLKSAKTKLTITAKYH